MSENTTVESPAKKPPEQIERINYALDTYTENSGETSQMRVSPKTEIILNQRQLKETRWLYNQYGQKTPSWLRGKFKLNQYRRKSLNDNLREAQLDKAFCGYYQDGNDWSGLLHTVWHQINKEPICL